MQIVIDIDENLLEGIKSDDFDFARRVVKNFQATIASAIANSTPIPDNATNGDVIKAIFPNSDIEEHRTYMKIVVGDYYLPCAYQWWNAPYQKGGKE